MTTKDIMNYVDPAMFTAPAMEAGRSEDGMIVPKVHLLWMTPDPLGANAAMGRMYKGVPTYNMEGISDDERAQFFTDSMATHLKAPLESIKLHFFIEGVTRSFTHQMVRQRTAVYAQESMRFAVKDNMAGELSIPPSIAELSPSHPTRQKWDEAAAKVSEVYNFLIANGIPAEDARGLAPHATTTRLNYVTDLRNLSDHAGNRLCTQAQFEWRIVFMSIVDAIGNYAPDFSFLTNKADNEFAKQAWEEKYRWQFKMIAKSELFRPVCYQLGKCPFNASFDRACSIRSRVEKFESSGVRSSEWGDYAQYEDGSISAVEWLIDHTAARKASGGAGH